MSFRDSQIHLRDILESIGHIDEFLEMDLQTYRSDRKTKSAVERELQIITEAAKRISGDAEKLCPGPRLERHSWNGRYPAACLPSRR